MLKQVLVERAFNKLGISSLTAETTPDDLSIGLTYLEDMLSEWSGTGICLEYRFEDVPKLTSKSNIPNWSQAAVYNNLAVILAPIYKINVTPILAAQANAGITLVSKNTVRINEICYPKRMPRGSGNTIHEYFSRRFFGDIRND